MTRHDTFVVERALRATPSAVFAAFAEDPRRRRWIRMPGQGAGYDHDFRVGGGETATSTFRHDDGRVERLENRSVHLLVEPGRRLVHAYTALVDDEVRWASLVTVELAPAPEGGTVLRWTEQVAFTADPGADGLPHLIGAVRLRLNGLDEAAA